MPRLHLNRMYVTALACVAFLVLVKVSSWKVLGYLAAVCVLHGLVGGQTAKTAVNGKTVFITGAGSGLGRALALSAARKGAKALYLCGRRTQPLQVTRTLIEGATASYATKPQVLIYELDVSNEEQVTAVSKKVVETHGCPDIIVNNAGMGSWLHMEDTTMENNRKMTASPYLGAFNVTRSFVTEMMARGTGHILNITSSASVIPMRSTVSYQAMRAAMRAFSLSLGEDLREYPKIGVTLLNSAEITGTEYEVANRLALPWIMTLPPVKALEYDTDRTADKTWNGVQDGEAEIVLPESLWPVFWLYNTFPDFAMRLLRLGTVGWRASEKKTN